LPDWFDVQRSGLQQPRKQLLGLPMHLITAYQSVVKVKATACF
jgi:hypothetical protein